MIGNSNYYRIFARKTESNEKNSTFYMRLAILFFVR